MSYSSRGSSYSRPARSLPSSLGQAGASSRPTDLNKRGFASRFASDIVDIGVNLPRALLGMVGAVGADTVMRAGRAITPGGSTGFDYSSQILDEIVKPIGQSLGDTAGLVGDVVASPFSADAREDLGEAREQFFANPGMFTVEHLGNLSLAGSAASVPLKAAARQAAGQATRASTQQGLTGGAGRAANRAQIQEIIDAGGPGAAQARAGQISGDLIGHPYRLAGRGLRDTHLPNIGALRSGEGYVPNASAGEVLTQIRETTPGDRMLHTPDMQDAATMRSLRDGVEDAQYRLGQAEADGSVNLAERLRGELDEARAQADSFETANAGRLETLEAQRLAPKAIEEMTSPLARNLRQGLNTERVQSLTAPMNKLSREVRGMVQELREAKTDSAFDNLTLRDPGSRRTLAIRQVRDLAAEIPDEMAAAGIDASVLGGPMSRTDDAALFGVLQQIAENPELRAQLPRLESSLDLTLLDLYESQAGLESGAIRNQLYDDATLTPRIANTLRDVQRAGGAAIADVPAGHTRLYRGATQDRVPSATVDGGPTADFRGRYFTPDEELARAFAEESGGTASYVDVPDEVLAQLRNAETPEAAFSQMKNLTEGSDEIILPQELVDLAQPAGALSPGARQAVDTALGKAYRIPDEQLANPVSSLPEPVQAAYERALAQFTKEAADRDVLLASYGLGDPEVWAMRAVKEDGNWRAMAPGENPSLRATPSAKQARKLKSLGRRVTAARSRLETLTQRAEEGQTAARAGAYDAYKRASREQLQAARAWDRARRSGDVELAESLRRDLDAARERAARNKVEARKDIVTETRAAQRALESVVKAMGDETLPIGGSDALAMEVRGLTDQLTTLFNDADFTPPARLARVLADLELEGIGTNVADINLLENVVRSGEVDPQVASQWADSAESARAAVGESRQARFNTRTMEPLIRAEERARTEARKLRSLERRLDNVDGRLGARDLDALDAARIRSADASDLVARTAEDVGLSAKGGGKAVAERLLREQVRARMKEAELARASRAFDRVEQKFAEVENELLNSIEAAPAAARPVLQISRAMHELDGTLRAEGLTDLADQLDLQGLPRLLEDMEAQGVSPTFMRRMEERLAAQGYRAAQEGPVRTSKMSSQKRREMGDVEVRRDVDRVKAETDIELSSRILGGEMVDNFLTRFGRKSDQIAQSLIEEGKLNKEAWRDMSKKQRERVLQEAGYNQYQPESIFGFRVRNTSPDGDWIPTHLNDSLTEFSKSGTLEKVLTQVVGPLTTGWKHFLLALRPAWQVNNIIGNAAMMTLAGGMGARSYLEFMAPGSQAHTMLRQHRLGWDMEQGFGLTKELTRDLFDSGLSRDLVPDQSLRAKLSDALVEPEAMKGVLDSGIAGRAGKARRGLNQLTGASYRLNSFFDNLNRSSLYLEGTLKQGLSPEEAVRQANRVVGEYTKMSPTEKVYVRSVFPFYAWMRHITRLSSDMLRPDNITKATTLASVVQTLGEPNGMEEMFPDYMAGDVLIPGTDTAVGMRGFNPWQDVADPFVYNGKISTRGAMRSMHPLIQFGMERATGIDTLTGRPFSRPIPELDDLGREVPTAPSLGEHTISKFAPPQVDLARNVYRRATSQEGARYASGDPVLIEGARQPDLAVGVASFLGAPLRRPELEGIQERRDAATDRVSRQIERYSLEVQAYEEQRASRTLPERLVPFGS